MKVTVVSGYAVQEFITRKYPRISLDVVPDVQTGLRKVSFGTSDAFVENLATASYYIEREGFANLRVAGQSGYAYRMAFGSRKDWPMLNRILTKGLAQMSAREKKAVYRKWVPLEPRSLFASKSFQTGMLVSFAAILLLIAGIGFWNRSLAKQVRARTRELEKELGERRRIEEELRHARDELEKRVAERTVDLVHANEKLQYEITVRKRTESVIMARLRLLEFAVTHTLGELLQATLDEAEALTDSRIGFCHFLGPDQNTLSLQSWSTRTKEVFCTASIAGRHYGVSEAGVWVDCIRERRPVIHNDYASLPHRKGMPADHVQVIRELVLPVMRDNRIVAILGVGNKADDYTRHDVETVSLLGDLAWDIAERKRAEEQLLKKKELLEELNGTLEKRVRAEVAKNRQKDIVLIQQNRQAAMGEMLDHIAHQWKQPITSLSLIVQDLGDTWANNEMSDESVTEAVGTALSLLEHMSQTIDVFRDFYRPDKERKEFSIKDSIDEALTFIAPALKHQRIGVALDADPDMTAIGYPKEYTQVLLNILTNARDAARARGLDDPMVTIRAFAEDDKAVVTISDNAGGIPEPIIGKVFELYFSTRESGCGSGVGLYMSRNIIERNMGGTLSVANVGRGAQFRIELDSVQS
jgi:C4-dicarboxylate-specific signal transduction histidine kinase